MADIDATQRVIEHLLTHFAGQAGGAEQWPVSGRRAKASMTKSGRKQSGGNGL
ncbi:hypothetical protein [Mesorhizobium sp. M7A.F.Ca.US.011.01.1.1]|uniref:hypothetical protein n=1 Tax=Mesorhizobium sp. M7A.F.Ca.US.011.01.1.1 TaxID=2496741 RepID=UPI0013E34876|nr:hypothetical protein [Mesorhizobium sp. M7A.F.Ca.US.011.01.1.1]